MLGIALQFIKHFYCASRKPQRWWVGLFNAWFKTHIKDNYSWLKHINGSKVQLVSVFCISVRLDLCMCMQHVKSLETLDLLIGLCASFKRQSRFQAERWERMKFSWNGCDPSRPSSTFSGLLHEPFSGRLHNHNHNHPPYRHELMMRSRLIHSLSFSRSHRHSQSS